MTVDCEGETFSAKGKSVVRAGWKMLEEAVKMRDASKTEKEEIAIIPKVEEGQEYWDVGASTSEHYTSPPKAYSEDTLLAAMESAGSKEFDEDAERKGLGTPATRASIIEKLVYSGYATRKGKQIQPTEDGTILCSVVPEYLKSATMTAEWENQLLEMEHGEVQPEKFMEGIRRLVGKVLRECRELPDEERYRLREKKEAIGVCPVCGSPVYEGKKNFYCENRECIFTLWKENRYLESMKKKIDLMTAAKLLESGKCSMKGLYSAKKDKFFDADLLMQVKDGRVQFSLEFPNSKQQK